MNGQVPTFSWRPDDDGIPGNALYFGAFCIGCVYYQLAPDQNTRADPWMAVLNTCAEGTDIGYYATVKKARTALIEAAERALAGER